MRVVAGTLELKKVNVDDIASAAGVNKLNNVTNYARAACEYVHQQLVGMCTPLIRQTVARAVYVLTRLADLSKGLVDARRRSRWTSDAPVVDLANVDLYPYFTYEVKELYKKFVDAASRDCLEKLMDEFYGTRTIYWEYVTFGEVAELPMERSESSETKKALDSLASSLFARHKDRIVKNVALKMYNFLLVPVQADLPSHIQGHLSTMSDDDLAKVFDLAGTKAKLEAEHKLLNAKVDELNSLEQKFTSTASHFSHPKEK